MRVRSEMSPRIPSTAAGSTAATSAAIQSVLQPLRNANRRSPGHFRNTLTRSQDRIW